MILIERFRLLCWRSERTMTANYSGNKTNFMICPGWSQVKHCKSIWRATCACKELESDPVNSWRFLLMRHLRQLKLGALPKVIQRGCDHRGIRIHSHSVWHSCAWLDSAIWCYLGAIVITVATLYSREQGEGQWWSQSLVHLSYFMEKGTDTHRGQVACPKSHD